MDRRSGGVVIRRLTMLAMMTAILLVQEEALAVLPNIQLTFMLIFTYAGCLTYGEVLMIVVVHVFLDSLWMGALNPVMMSVMVIGYAILALLGRISRNTRLWCRCILSGVGALIYCWLFALIWSRTMHVPIMAYLASDVVFEILLVVSTVIPMAVLHEPLRKLIKKWL